MVVESQECSRHMSDAEYGRDVSEAKIHDVAVLPHMHGEELICDLFPEAVAEDSPDEIGQAIASWLEN